MRTAIKKLGASVIEISHRDPAARLRALKGVVRSRPSAFLVIDGRGPYFSVGTGIVNLARTLNATIVPCAIASSPHLSLRGRTARVQVPLPRSRVHLSLGRPVSFDTQHAGARATAGASLLQESLFALASSTRDTLRVSLPGRRT
jgi:lysophospholipid acyltransferase (LPLAT)-like uncharacterized protein